MIYPVRVRVKIECPGILRAIFSLVFIIRYFQFGRSFHVEKGREGQTGTMMID